MGLNSRNVGWVLVLVGVIHAASEVLFFEAWERSPWCIFDIFFGGYLIKNSKTIEKNKAISIILLIIIIYLIIFWGVIDNLKLFFVAEVYEKSSNNLWVVFTFLKILFLTAVVVPAIKRSDYAIFFPGFLYVHSKVAILSCVVFFSVFIYLVLNGPLTFQNFYRNVFLHVGAEKDIYPGSVHKIELERSQMHNWNFYAGGKIHGDLGTKDFAVEVTREGSIRLIDERDVEARARELEKERGQGQASQNKGAFLL